jgi:MFS transporter, PAT family, solute carrier family 33 (acetyl-CoA transportor), member 1
MNLNKEITINKGEVEEDEEVAPVRLEENGTTKIESKQTNKTENVGIRKDLLNIIFLNYMYFIQGLPLGLAYSVSIILASSKSSFSDQGTFTFAYYPFSLKLLWAPIVDTVFVKRIGRRKTWLFLVQILLCILMFTTANYVQRQLENSRNSSGS